MSPEFLFVTCQVGAEKAVKDELARSTPDLRLAYSCPGFLTFKLPAGAAWPDDFELRSVFARASGFSLGPVSGTDDRSRAEAVWQMVGDEPIDVVHAWPRDTRPSGERNYEPGLTPRSREVAAALATAHAERFGRAIPSGVARRGQRVLDCVLLDDDRWWIGYHRARSRTSRWPGGMIALEPPPDAVSRAWLKMEELLRWTRLPLEPGDRCAEIGCAPGGTTQALLARGVHVLGIDPALVDPRVAAHPHFMQLQLRGRDVRRRALRGIRWLVVDINVAPQYALDTVADLVQHPAVDVRGVVMMLKLLSWDLAGQLPEYLAQIRSWGFADVRARQLQFNRQEVAVVAMKVRRRGRPRSRRVSTVQP